MLPHREVTRWSIEVLLAKHPGQFRAECFDNHDLGAFDEVSNRFQRNPPISTAIQLLPFWPSTLMLRLCVEGTCCAYTKQGLFGHCQWKILEARLIRVDPCVEGLKALYESVTQMHWREAERFFPSIISVSIAQKEECRNFCCMAYQTISRHNAVLKTRLTRQAMPAAVEKTCCSERPVASTKDLANEQWLLTSSSRISCVLASLSQSTICK